jgi:hypothetical protein
VLPYLTISIKSGGIVNSIPTIRVVPHFKSRDVVRVVFLATATCGITVALVNTAAKVATARINELNRKLAEEQAKEDV